MSFSVCPICGEKVGVYEPAVLVRPGGSAIRGSRLTLEPADGEPLMHELCYEQADNVAPGTGFGAGDTVASRS